MRQLKMAPFGFSFDFYRIRNNSAAKNVRSDFVPELTIDSADAISADTGSRPDRTFSRRHLRSSVACGSCPLGFTLLATMTSSIKILLTAAFSLVVALQSTYGEGPAKGPRLLPSVELATDIADWVVHVQIVDGNLSSIRTLKRGSTENSPLAGVPIESLSPAGGTGPFLRDSYADSELILFIQESGDEFPAWVDRREGTKRRFYVCALNPPSIERYGYDCAQHRELLFPVDRLGRCLCGNDQLVSRISDQARATSGSKDSTGARFMALQRLPLMQRRSPDKIEFHDPLAPGEALPKRWEKVKGDYSAFAPMLSLLFEIPAEPRFQAPLLRMLRNGDAREREYAAHCLRHYRTPVVERALRTCYRQDEHQISSLKDHPLARYQGRFNESEEEFLWHPVRQAAFQTLQSWGIAGLQPVSPINSVSFHQYGNRLELDVHGLLDKWGE